MEEALFRVTITLANFLQKLVWLKLLGILSDTDIAVNILTLIKLKVEAGQRQHYIAGVSQHQCINIGFATQSQILEIYMKMWKLFFLCCFPSAMIIQFCGSSFAEFFVSGCLIMMSLFRSSLLLCSLLCQFADLSSICTTLLFIM